ncbi:MAG: DUF6259 domain-containing protein [Victivallaceae bacterium]|nr:DUF6259 domain-containing protein [Victivallaceae bacterium]
MSFLKPITFSILLLVIIVVATQDMMAEQQMPVKIASANCEVVGKGWRQPGSTKERGSLGWQQGAGTNGSTALVVKSTKANNYFYNTTEVKLNSSALELTLWAKGDGELKVHQMLYASDKKYINQRNGIAVQPAAIRLTTEWQKYSFKIQIEDNNAKFMKIYLAPTQPGTIYIDDVKLFYNMSNKIGADSAAVARNKTIYVPVPEKSPRRVAAKNDFIVSDDLLYRITLWENGDYRQKKIIIGTKAELAGEGSKNYPECKVSYTITDKPDGTHYKINVEAKAPYGVYEVEYPLMRIYPISGSKYDRLLVPNQYGAVLENPFNRKERDNGGRPRLKKSVWYGVYGSKQQNMQMIIYENGRQGAMIWTQDNNGWIKDFEVSSDLPEKYKDNALRVAVHHFPTNTGQPGVGWKSPYPVVVTKFTQGWYNAVQIYKKWALRQKWCAKGTIIKRIERGELPKWYLNQPMWLTLVNYNMLYLLENYSRLLPNIDFGVFVTQWQRWPFDSHLPEYLPPKNPAGFKKVMAWQKKRMHIFPYMNASLVDTDYKLMDNKFKAAYIKDPISMAAIKPINGWTTPSQVEYWGHNRIKATELKAELKKAWSGPIDETILAKINSDWMGLYWWQRERLVKKLRENWGGDTTVIDKIAIKRRLRPVCRSNAQWRDFWVDELASKLVKQYGSNGIYLDQLIVGGVYTCWSKKHQHQPGFGNYFLNGSHQLAAAIRQKNPQIVMKMECANEYLIDEVNDSFVVFPYIWRSRQYIPLFTTVYQGYVSLHEWYIMPPTLNDLNDFTATLAIPLHMGYKIGSFYTTTTHMELFKARNRPALDYLVKLIKMKQQTMDVFAYGEKLQEPEVVNSPYHQITYYKDKKGQKTFNAIRPVVESSLWRSYQDKNKTLLLLTNSGDQEQTLKVIADIKPGTKLTDLQGQSIVYSPEQPIKVDKFSFRALLTK